MSFHHVYSENTLHVKSSVDTTTSKQDSKDLSGTLSMTMYGGGSGLGATLGYGEGHQNSDSTTNTNAELLAKNINITTTNDASFKGATVKADDTLNVKVGGDLSVESQRDSSSSNSKGFNVSVSASLGKDKDYTANEKDYANKTEYYNAQDKLNNTVGARVGTGLGSTGASFGASTGTSQSKQTVLTSLTGENVNVEVEGNTHIKGALIAAGETNEQGVFEDNEKLKLKTDTLTFANSSNTQFSSSNSFNVGTNIGYGNAKDAKPSTTPAGNDDPKSDTKVNSSSLSLSNQMGYSGSKTLATVGKGDVQVGDTENSDDLTRLNRDTTKVNKELYSGSVGTSVTAVLDHRFLSEDGWKLIAQDFVKTGMMLDTINQVVSNQTVGLSELGAELRKREITYETVKERIAQDKDLAAALNSPAYTDEQKKAITNGITQQVMIELGYKPIENVLIATTEPGRDGYQVKGFFSLETGKAYMNDFYNNTNVDLLTTAGAETQRAIDAQKGSNFDQSKEYRDARSTYSQNFGSNIASYADFALYFTGQGSLSTGSNSISTSPQTLANNAEFAGLNKELGDNSTTVYSRLVKVPGNATGTHLFAVVDGTNYSSGKRIISMEGKIEGGIPVVNTVEGFKNDRNALDEGKVVDNQIIKIPQGMTEQEFDTLVLSNAEKFDTKNNINKYPDSLTQVYYLFFSDPLSKTHTNKNSNTFIDNVIESSGGVIKDFNGALFQNAGETTENDAKKTAQRLNLPTEQLEKEIKQFQGFKE